jgi:hypothetical protein
MAALLAACAGNATGTSPVLPSVGSAQNSAPAGRTKAATSSCGVTHCIYVANDTGSYADSITVYPLNANGNVTPVQSISGANTGLSYPAGVAVDQGGNVYVTNSSYPVASITVYAPGANGNIAPIRTIEGSSTDLHSPRGIAVNSKGEIYVADAGAQSVLVFAAGANGNVAPSRTVPASHAQGIALHGRGANAIFAVTTSYYGRQYVYTFLASADNYSSPLTVINGGYTLLHTPFSVAISQAKGSSGDIYVGNLKGGFYGNESVVVFGAGANGNVPPIANFCCTGYYGVTGVAVDRGQTYVTVSDAVYVFAKGANSYSGPIRQIVGSYTGLVNPDGIAVH